MSNLLGETSRGLIFIVSAPGGTGKTTLVKKLCSEFSNILQSVSYTTRQPRPGEVDGREYFFVSKDEFQKKLLNQHFLEHANVYEDFYGTCKKQIEENSNKGIHSVLVIDTQGAIQLVGKIDATFIFIHPPSFEELKRRLLTRCSSQKEMVARLASAEKEQAVSHLYDYQLINNDFLRSYSIFRSIFISETHRSKHLKTSRK
jgi:guanylate kinase